MIAASTASQQTVTLALTGGTNGSQIVTQITVTGNQGNIRQATLLVIVKDPAATAADRIQTGQDRTQTGLDAAAAAASALEAATVVENTQAALVSIAADLIITQTLIANHLNDPH